MTLDADTRRLASLQRRVGNLSTDTLRLQWRSITDEGLWEGTWRDAPSDVARPLEFAVTRTGLVVFRGAAWDPFSASPLDPMFTLPEGFRPRYDTTGNIVVQWTIGAAHSGGGEPEPPSPTGDAVARYIWVRADGEIQVGSGDFDYHYIYFDGARFAVNG